MTPAEIAHISHASGRARQALSTINSLLSPLGSPAANAELSILSDFLRNVESVLTAARDAIAAQEKST